MRTLGSCEYQISTHVGTLGTHVGMFDTHVEMFGIHVATFATHVGTLSVTVDNRTELLVLCTQLFMFTNICR